MLQANNLHRYAPGFQIPTYLPKDIPKTYSFTFLLLLKLKSCYIIATTKMYAHKKVITILYTEWSKKIGNFETKIENEKINV